MGVRKDEDIKIDNSGIDYRSVFVCMFFFGLVFFVRNVYCVKVLGFFFGSIFFRGYVYYVIF